MLKYFVAATLLFLTACSESGSDRSTIIESSVQIGGFCSGTVIEKQPAAYAGSFKYTVLTAKHCVTGDPKMPVMPDLGDPFPVVKFTYTGDDRNAEAYEGKLSKIDMDDDFALIDFTTIDDLMVAPIATQEIIDSLKFAEPIYNASFPYSLEQVYGEGWLGHLVTPSVGPTGEQMFEMKSLRMVNIDVAPGSQATSGSSLFRRSSLNFYSYPSGDHIIFRLGNLQVMVKKDATDNEVAAALIMLGTTTRKRATDAAPQP
jgi:hypothetical protein